jgi:hypothetical protein
MQAPSASAAPAADAALSIRERIAQLQRVASANQPVSAPLVPATYTSSTPSYRSPGAPPAPRRVVVLLRADAEMQADLQLLFGLLRAREQRAIERCDVLDVLPD